MRPHRSPFNMRYRFLTQPIPGLGGILKVEPEDFVVEEALLYEPSGEGEHAYVRVEKRGISTLEALSRLARTAGVREGEAGYAGLKDAASLARQTFSFRGVDPSRFRGLALDGLRVLAVARHRNKLRVGHLRGNRFRVRVREVARGRESCLREVLEILSRRGVPNYFGPQRFGLRGNNHRVGAALLRGDFREALRELAGAPEPGEGNPAARRARELFEAEREEEALSLFPPGHATERSLLTAYLRGGRDPSRSLRTLPGRMRKFFLCAYQSHLFNRCLERRLDALDVLLRGDIAIRHSNGAAFRVEEPEREAPRAERFEVSPSGPLLGPRMLWPEGEPGELERRTLEEETEGVTAAIGQAGGTGSVEPLSAAGAQKNGPFRCGPVAAAVAALGRSGLPGGRRALRYRLEELVWELRGRDLFLSFFVPRGSYATAALAEIMKNEGSPRGEPRGEAGHEDFPHRWHGLRGERAGTATLGGRP